MEINMFDECVEYTSRKSGKVKIYIRRGWFKDIIMYNNMVIGKRYFGFIWTRTPRCLNEFSYYNDSANIMRLLD